MTRSVRTWRLRSRGVAAAVAFAVLTGCRHGGDEVTGPPPPPAISKLGTDPTEIIAGNDFGDSIRVRVVDGSGNPKGGLGVSFLVGAGGGSVFPAMATTDAQGRAAARFTTGTAVGSNSATATVTGGGSVSFSAVTVPGPARSIAFARRIAIVDVGSSLSPELAATDANGNAVPPSRLVFDNRTLGVVTVSPAGAVTGQRQGQTIVVASSPGGGAADSMLVIVAAPNGPLVMSDLSRFDLRSDTTLDVVVSLDIARRPRSSARRR